MSRYRSPVPVLHVLYRSQALPQHPVGRVIMLRIGIHHRARNLTHILQELLITCQVGNLEVEGNTALLCTLDITRAT